MEPAPDSTRQARVPLPAAAQHALDVSSLADAERRVLALALSGLTVAEIAARLALAEAAVRALLGRVYGKLGVTGRADLVTRVAAEAARDDPPPERGVDGPDRRPPSELRLVLVLVVGLAVVVLVSVVYPPAMVVTGPALMIGGWRLRQSRRSSALGFAALWILLVGVVLSLFALVLLLGILLLTVTGAADVR